MRLLTTGIFFFVIAGSAQADTLSEARKSLEMWNPKQVTLSNGTLTAVLPQRRITTEIYTTVIQAGICLGVLMNRKLPGVKEVVMLNEFGAQGFVYEEGTQSCEKINNSSGQAANIEIASRTHVY